MNITTQPTIHIYPSDLKKGEYDGKIVEPGLIFVHAEITVPQFLATTIWEKILHWIQPGTEYAIITEWSEPMMMSIKNLQIRH